MDTLSTQRPEDPLDSIWHLSDAKQLDVLKYRLADGEFDNSHTIDQIAEAFGAIASRLIELRGQTDPPAAADNEAD